MFMLTAQPGKVPYPQALYSKKEQNAAGHSRPPQPIHTLSVPRNTGVQPHRGEQAVMVSHMCHEDESGEKRKGFQEIRCCLVHPVRQPAQWRNCLLSAARSPPVTILKTDQVRSNYQLHKAKDDAGD